ncbi:MAG: hypothetical protein ACEY26_00705 [Candidatus Hodgkinia cicadicola]
MENPRFHRQTKDFANESEGDSNGKFSVRKFIERRRSPFSINDRKLKFVKFWKFHVLMIQWKFIEIYLEKLWDKTKG